MTDMLTLIQPDGATENGYDAGLSDAELIHCYRTMLLVRSFDEICLKLQRSGRIGFSIPNRGIEATQVGAASALQKSDWIFPSYRDFGMALYHGIPAVEMMHNMFGNALDSAKGRQMPVHFSFVEPIHFYSISSPIGTHLPHAVGAAYASKLRGEDTVHLVSFGDGGTSSLGFHSGMNFAAVWKAPVVFLCQNNGYAISCPSDEQTASDGYAIKAEAYGMRHVTVDGNDLFRRPPGRPRRRGARPPQGRGPDPDRGGDLPHGRSLDLRRPHQVRAEGAGRGVGEEGPRGALPPLPREEGPLEPEAQDDLRAETLAEIDAQRRPPRAPTRPAWRRSSATSTPRCPNHIRAQGEFLFDLTQRRGEADVGRRRVPPLITAPASFVPPPRPVTTPHGLRRRTIPWPTSP